MQIALKRLRKKKGEMFSSVADEGYKDSYTSPDGRFTLQLGYEGSHGMGDAWHYGYLLDNTTQKKIWTQEKNQQIRQLNCDPWSYDSHSCYFSLSEEANTIVRLDPYRRREETIYPKKAKEGYLYMLRFVPEDVDGVVFYTFPGREVENKSKHNYYLFKNEEKTLTLLNKYVNRLTQVGECHYDNSILLLTENKLVLFDIRLMQVSSYYQLTEREQKMNLQIQYNKEKKQTELISYEPNKQEWKRFELIMIERTRK